MAGESGSSMPVLAETLVPNNHRDVETVVDTHANLCREYAYEAFYGKAGSFDGVVDWLTSMKTVVESGYAVEWSDLAFEFPPITIDDYSPVAPTTPTIDIDTPNSPEVPTLASATLNSITIPSFETVAPTISIPNAPTPSEPSEPGDAPELSEPEYPASPALTLPTVPTVDEVTIPEPPSVSLPSFEESFPDYVVEIPGVLFHYNETAYTSQLATNVTTKLLADLAAGGTGRGTAVETALYARARDRNSTKNLELYEAVELDFERRGWHLPSGAMVGRLYEVQREVSRSEEQINYEITIEEGNKIYEYARDSIKLIVEWEKELMSNNNALAQRTFEAAKAEQDAAIQVYNAKVAYYNMQLQAYQTAASVYAERIRANSIILDQYKAQLEGKRLHSDIQARYVEIYARQIEAQRLYIDIYRTEMEAARLKVDIERARIEGYGQQINAYAAHWNANTARFNAYMSQVTGEKAKADVYDSQVRGYLGRVQGAEIESRINIAEAEFTLKQNDQTLERYKAELMRYDADIKALVAEADTQAKVFGFEVEKYKGDIDHSRMKIEAQIKSYEALQTHEREQIRLMIEEARINQESAMANYNLRNEALKTGVSSAAQVFGMAINSFNASASLGSSVSAGQTIHETVGLSRSLGENYHYSASVDV